MLPPFLLGPPTPHFLTAIGSSTGCFLAPGPLHLLFPLSGALPALLADPFSHPSGPQGPALTSLLKQETPCYSLSLHPVSGPFGTYHGE